MAKFSPGNEDLCFTCHLMQKCTDACKLPPCLGVIEPAAQSGEAPVQQTQPAICPLCGTELYTEGEAKGACRNFDCTYEWSGKQQAGA